MLARTLKIGGALTLLGAVGVGSLRLTAIAPLLPMREGQTVCFTAQFEGRTLTLNDWSRQRLVDSGQTYPDGRPLIWHYPIEVSEKPVRRLTLALTYDSRKADYDWIYNFHLAADVEGFDTPLRAAGECPWYRDRVPNLTPGLGCYIDCDGGVVDVERVVGQRAVRLVFDPRLPLRMKLGCGGEGTPYTVATQKDAPGFRLEQAPGETCAPMLQRRAVGDVTPSASAPSRAP